MNGSIWGVNKMPNDSQIKKEKLAIDGGLPVRENLLPYDKQFIDEEDIHAVIEVLKNVPRK